MKAMRLQTLGQQPLALPGVVWFSLMLRQSLASTPTPTVLSVPPSESFVGNDGPWSGFELRIGTPPQDVDVFVSTTGSETFVVLTAGCQPDDPTSCPSDRGGLFQISKSTTWNALGNYSLSLDTNLGLNSAYDGGEYGLDNVALGWQGSGLPTLNNQVVAGTPSTDFWIGVFGISPYQSNLSGFNPDESHPTYLQTLKNSNIIPSLSWGYTGGAQYRLKNALASLTFGGYDTSLFTPSDVSFDFGPDNNRDLTLYIQSISYRNSSQNDIPLLPPDNPGPILTFIDSTAPAIWLPLSACQAIENAFNLTWNDTYGYYFVSDTLHNELTASNPNITFTLSNVASGGPTVNITLPYAAFDKTLGYGVGFTSAAYSSGSLPALESQRYFPLQRAANSTQYTLGKTFLQEAYIIVDYERMNFTVNPCIWNQGAKENLVPICSVDATGCTSPMGSGPDAPGSVGATAGTNSELSVSPGAIAGTVIGILALLICGLLIFWWMRRRSRRQSEERRNTGGIDPNWPGHGVPEEAQKPHQQVIEIDSSPLNEVGAYGSRVKLEYYGEHPKDEVFELPTDGGIIRQMSRPAHARHSRSRNSSTGKDSNISELSSSDVAGRTRPSLVHRRNTSDGSKVSDTSTAQEDGQVSPASNLGNSPAEVSPLTETLLGSTSPMSVRIMPPRSNQEGSPDENHFRT